MTIDGKIKFFGSNNVNADDSFSFTSATEANAEFLYDRSCSTKLQSSGSDDSTPEVWEITFPGARDIDRVLVANHNIKSGKIEYWNGSAYVAFSPAVTWSAETASTNYFEFTSVSITKIRLTMDTTQVVDAEKYVGELLVFKELGTVSRNPEKANPDYPESSKKYKTSQGGTTYVYFGSKLKIKLDFKQSPQADLTLFRALKDRASPFFVYLSGGQTGYTEEGYREQDIYYVNYINSLKYKLSSTLHGSGVDIKIELAEV